MKSLYAVLLVLSVLFASCDNSTSTTKKSSSSPTPPPKPDKAFVTVTFDTSGGSAVEAQKVSIGESITKPTDITKEGFHFVGWYKDEKRTILFNFDTEKVTQSIILYAEWIFNETISAGAFHALYIKDDGTLWGWGYNGVYQLGVEPQGAKKLSPVQISSDTWRMVSAGVSHSVGIKEDGTLWAWGYNKFGQVGIGKACVSCGSPSPTQVSSDTWRMVSAGETHTIGIKTDGTLWAWGENNQGEFGLGDTTNRSIPTQVGSDTWRMIDAGTDHTVGIKTDGTLWTWGWNGHGQLGSEGNTNRHIPKQVGSDTWRIVSAGLDHSIGIKTDGTLWRLRGGRTEKIGSDTWHFVDAGDSFVLAIKEDGTLWAWGQGRSGRLGTGNTGYQNSFTKVGTDTWRFVNGGQEALSCGIKNDGTPWTWGSRGNKYGELGIGSNTKSNIPVQVIFTK